MDKIWIVKIIDGFSYLIDDVLLVSLLKVGRFTILPDESMQIDIHVFKD